MPTTVRAHVTSGWARPRGTSAARRLHRALDIAVPIGTPILEAELRAVKAEQKKLTKAVALADDVPELVTELRERATRARSLEVRIAATRRAPDALRGIVDQAEATVRERLGDIRAQLAGRDDLRRVFLRLFPEGLRFLPARVGSQQVWKIEGQMNYGQLVGDELPEFSSVSDPKGT